MPQKTDVVILGAGVSGISAALTCLEAGLDFRVIEAGPVPGGFARTREVNGYRFDCGGHFIHSVSSEKNPGFTVPLVEECSIIQKNAHVYMREHKFSCPVQTHEPYKSSHDPSMVSMASGGLDDGFEQVYGADLASHFFKPYHRKVFQELYSEWEFKGLLNFMPRYEGTSASMSEYNRVFYYPKRGIGTWIDKLCGNIKGKMILNSKIRHIKPHCVETYDGRKFDCKYILSSIPLNSFATLCPSIFPAQGNEINRLHASGVIVVNLGIKQGTWPFDHWVYFPENEFPFFRIGSYSNVSSFMAPEGAISIYIELPNTSKFLAMSDSLLLKEMWPYLQKLKIINHESRVEAICVDRFRHVYPVQNAQNTRIVNTLSESASLKDIFFAGRLGKWQYVSMSQCMAEGRAVVLDHCKK